MQTNPPNQHASKDYPPRKEYTYPPSAPDQTSETSNPGFPHKPPTNPPLPSKTQPTSTIDTRTPNDQAYLNSSSNEPMQVKHMQVQVQGQAQPPPHPQGQSQAGVQGQGQQGHPQLQAQPIISPQTILALNYLQTHLLGGKNNALEHKVQTTGNYSPSKDNSYPDHEQNEPAEYHQYSGKPRDNYGPDQYQRGDRSGFRDTRGYNNNNKRDFHPRNPNMSYSSERAAYEKSRSRSNEKKGPYDRRPTFGGHHQRDGGNDRYNKNRNGYDKEHQMDRDFQQKARPDVYEDWKCVSCGNVNWARRGNCNKCGVNKPEDAPVVINPLRDSQSKTMPTQDRKITGNGSEGYNKNQFYRDGGRRNDYGPGPGNMEPRNNPTARPNYGTGSFKG